MRRNFVIDVVEQIVDWRKLLRRSSFELLSDLSEKLLLSLLSEIGIYPPEIEKILFQSFDRVVKFGNQSIDLLHLVFISVQLREIRC